MSQNRPFHQHTMAEYKQSSDAHLGWHASGQGYRPGTGIDVLDAPEQAAIFGGFAGAYLGISEPVLGALRERLTGHTLIDLGGREGLSPEVLGRLGITDYVSVDLRNSNGNRTGRRLVNSDALTYLSKYNRTANIMANGFLVGNFFQADRDSTVSKDIRVRDTEYVTRLYRHAARVLPPRGIMLGYALGFTNLAARQGLRQMSGFDHIGTEDTFGRETAPLVVLESTRR